MAHQLSPLSPRRIAAILAAMPSEAALDRSYRAGARTEAEAINMAHQRRIETAERHARGEHYGSANYGRRIPLYADTLTPQQAALAGAGFAPMPGVDALLDSIINRKAAA